MGKRGPNAAFNLLFSCVGLALGWGVRRFHNNSSMFSNPTELVNRKHPDYSWVGLAVGWGVRRFHSNSYMFFNPTEFGKSQAPYYCPDNRARGCAAPPKPSGICYADWSKSPPLHSDAMDAPLPPRKPACPCRSPGRQKRPLFPTKKHA